MNVVHILKGGSQVADITGHVVRVNDAGTLYQLIDNINRKGSESRKAQKERRVYG